MTDGEQSRAPAVLIIDDNSVYREQCTQALDAFNLSVFIAQNDDETMRLIQRQPFHCILVREGIASVDTQQQCQRLKQDIRFSDIPYVVLLESYNEKAILKALELGADDVVSARASPRLVAAKIDSLIKFRLRCKDRSLEQSTQLQDTNELFNSAYYAGISEVASGVLHNIGNFSNSIGIRIGSMNVKLGTLKVEHIIRVSQLLESHAPDIPFLIDDPKGRHVLAFLSQFGEALYKRNDEMHEDLAFLKEKLGHVNQIVSIYQQFRVSEQELDVISLPELIHEVACGLEDTCALHEVKLTTQIIKTPLVKAGRHRLLQILNNLLAAALRSSLMNKTISDKRVSIGCQPAVIDNDLHIKISVADTGMGIEPDTLNKIFEFGNSVTLGKNKRDFDLYACSNYIRLLRGFMRAKSDGRNKGAVFEIYLPPYSGTALVSR